MNFTTLQQAVAKQFKAMSGHQLYQTNIAKDLIWETYLGSFPAGANPIYKTRTEHDCSCCRHFVKNLGGVVNIIGGKLVTLWDFKIGGEYQSVVDAMSELVRTGTIDNIFLHPEATVGTAQNRQLLEDKSVKTWRWLKVCRPLQAGSVGLY